jgi:hypothetical protein
MDPFTQQVQRIENNDKTREIVAALRLIPTGDNATRDLLNETITKILTPAAHKIPETQQKITEFSFTEPELSYHDVAEKPKYRPMKHEIHYLDEDNTLYYNSEIEASEWEDENAVAAEARDEATAAAENEAAILRAYNTALARQQAINTRIFSQPPRWVLIKRRALNDTRMEDSLLQYIDKKHTQVDWYSTITTLHETGSRIGYTLDHYKRVLHRFISYFKPEMNQLGQKMGLEELARLLMTSTMPVNDREMIIHEIKKLTRRKTESLRVPMSNLYSLATTYYNDDPDRESQRNKLLFNGLQHFTTGITKEKLTGLIKYSQLQKFKLDYHDTLETCILSEKTNGEPAEDLQFGQSKETILVFQANITPVDSLLDNEITPIEFTLANPSKKRNKYEETTKPKKPDERQPHIHAVKTKIQTIPNHRERRISESEASTSSRPSSRQSSPHQSSPDRSRESSAEREKTPPPTEETPPSSSRRSRSKERNYGPRQRRQPSPSFSAKSPTKQLEMELSTAPKKKQKIKGWQRTENPTRKSERLSSKLYQMTALLNEINAENTPINSRNTSRERSRPRDTSDRRRNQDTDRRNSSDRQSRSDSRDRPRPRDRSSSRDRNNYSSSRDRNEYSSPRDRNNYGSSRDRNSRSRSRESYRNPRSTRDRSPSRNRSPYSDRYSTTSSRYRYRSNSRDRYSRDRTPTNYRSSRDSYNYRPESKSSNYSRSTRDRSTSRDRYSDRSRRSYSRDRDNYRRQRSRTPERQSSRRSQSPYQNKTIIPGLNCSPSYKPGTKFCRKCTNDSHEEPDCRQYYHWAPQKCTLCNAGFHFRDQCKLNSTKRSDSPGRPKNY